MSREIVEDAGYETVMPLPYVDVTPAIDAWMKSMRSSRSPKVAMLARGRKAVASKPRPVHQAAA